MVGEMGQLKRPAMAAAGVLLACVLAVVVSVANYLGTREAGNVHVPPVAGQEVAGSPAGTPPPAPPLPQAAAAPAPAPGTAASGPGPVMPPPAPAPPPARHHGRH
jgi:hypothetical protein